MIPIGGALPNSIASFNRAADHFARSFEQQAESVGIARGVDGVETPAGTGTETTHRDPVTAPERARLDAVEDSDAHDPLQSGIDLLRAEQDVRANIAVTRSQNRTVGSLLDIFA